MSEFNVWGYIARLGARVLGPGDSTLRAGDEVCAVEEPIFLVLEDVEEFLHQEYPEFQCNAPGCLQTFSQVYESEAHYRSVHSFSCSVCRKSLPSNHLLELHVQESHDSFFSVMSEKHASFQCFLPTCTSKFWTTTERRDHAITTHDFPSDFRFDNTGGSKHGGTGHKARKQGNKNRKQKQRSTSMKETNAGPEINMEVEIEAGDREANKGSKLRNESDLNVVSKLEGNRDDSMQVSKNILNDKPKEKSVNNNENTMEVDGETVVLRRNKNESGGGKSAGTSRRPISLARLPSPKLNTPQILNRPTSTSGSGRRNTISSSCRSERESNGNSTISSPRSGMETSPNANNVPALKLDSEGNTRGRRSTVSSSPRDSVVADAGHARGRRSTISASSRDSVDAEGNARGRRSTISTASSRDSVSLDAEGNARSRRNTVTSSSSSSGTGHHRIGGGGGGRSPKSSVGSTTSPRGHGSSTSPRGNNNSSVLSTPRGVNSPRGNGSTVTRYVNSSTLPKSLNSSPRPYSLNSYAQDLESMSDSPRKSKIPVRSASTSKAPKQFSFGVGIAKAFNRSKGKAWYQTKSQSQQHVDTSMDIETADFSSLRDTLPS